MTTYYKIKNKKTGLYKNAGKWNRWTRDGKVWTTLGRLRAHLTLTLNGYIIHDALENWEIVEYEVREIDYKNINDIIKSEKIIEILKK